MYLVPNGVGATDYYKCMGYYYIPYCLYVYIPRRVVCIGRWSCCLMFDIAVYYTTIYMLDFRSFPTKRNTP